jgi:hypothetical protein
VHLAAFTNGANAAIVRDEGVAAGPSRRVRETQTTGNDGTESIRAHDETAAELFSVDSAHASRAAGVVPHDVDHVSRFTDFGAGFARRVEQNGIENFAPNR